MPTAEGRRMRSRGVFASYSRHDREIVAPLCHLMRVGGTRVFRDEDSIPPGKLWQAVLTETLQTAQCVLVFWSANSAPSPAVREEYTAAIRLEKDVAPVLLDETPLAEALRPYQWIDCRSFVVVKPPPPPGGGISIEAMSVAAPAVVGAVWGMMTWMRDLLDRPVARLALRPLADDSRAELVESLAGRIFDPGGRR